MGGFGVLILTLLPLSGPVSAIPSRSSILSKVPFPSLTDYKHRINGLWRRGNHEGTVRRATNSSDSDSANLWVVDTLYEGQDFFDGFDFYTDKDPTNGQVQYVDRDTAFGENLAYVTSDDKIVMKVDNTTWLTQGQNRKSVRIQSKKRFNGGLFILDLEKAPHGCGTWPAFWTVGPNWPAGGEIDIFEGVHENTRNQATFHTGDGCTITNPQNFTGNVLATNCYAYADDNAGCGLINDSAASFGAPFNAVGGGVFASRWDSNGVWIWFFHRYTIPNDITNKVPNPELWGKPTALLSNTSCPPNKYFWDHQIVFDITFCGDWAGASYSGDGCPGTCSDHVLDPNNFYNTTWSINYVHVFRNSHVSGSVNAAIPRISPITSGPLALALVTLVIFGTRQEMTCKNAEPFRARNVVLVLSALATQSHALSLHLPRSPTNMYLSKPFSAIKRAFTAGRRQNSTPNSNSNDTANLWVVDSLYEGQNFYDQWDFFNYPDPTNGMVEYVDRETAFREGLAYVTPNNKIVMKVDNTTVLKAGEYRKSVRIQSKKRYNGGLFIIDIERAPHACSAWPAFWTVGPNWPHGGEIDIFEGVHESTKNQATFHTASGCKITEPQNFTGNLVSDDCSHDYGGMGCGLINDSVASFGAPFNAVGGGVFATRWDDDGVWGWFFHRSTIPRDITSNTPNPKNWGKPTVLLSPRSCPPRKYFWDHVIVFDITLCGDLGGPTYADSGCPGTCAEQVMNPTVFNNASWSVNYVHVFRNSKVLGSIPSSANPTSHPLDTTFLFWTVLFACWAWRSLRAALMN